MLKKDEEKIISEMCKVQIRSSKKFN